MTLSVFIAFWAVSILFVITPGADWAYAISAGLKGRVVIPAVGGLLSGHLIATMIVAGGVGTLVANHPTTLTVLTSAGRIWLTGRTAGTSRRCSLCQSFLRRGHDHHRSRSAHRADAGLIHF